MSAGGEKFKVLPAIDLAALRVHGLLRVKPLVTIQDAAARLGLSQPTVTKSLDHLVALGIVRETSGRRRGRTFVYDSYLRLLNEGTEPIGEERNAL